MRSLRWYGMRYTLDAEKGFFLSVFFFLVTMKMTI